MKPPRENPYPHLLIGMPRSLAKSPGWLRLCAGARYYFLYLLSRSNTRSFKDVWPGIETIEAETGLDSRTRRRYEAQLKEEKFLKIIPPGRRDREGITRNSRRLCFTITKFINIDFRNYNEKSGSQIYEPIRDVQALEERLEQMARKNSVDISRVERKVDLIEAMLDQVAQRVQITGTDDRGNVHLTLHSEKYSPEFVQDALPSNVLVFPSKKNQDLIVAPKQSWLMLEKLIVRAFEAYQRHKKMQPLFDIVEKFSDEPISKAQ